MDQSTNDTDERSGWYASVSFNENVDFTGDPYPLDKKEDGPDFHPGEDWNGQGTITGDACQPVFPIGRGVVIGKGSARGFGYMLLILHKIVLQDGLLPTNEFFVSVFAHLHEEPPVELGSIVDSDTPVAKIGDTGSESPHLHWEIRQSSFLVFTNISVELNTLDPRFGPSAWPASLATDNGQAFIAENYCEPSAFVSDPTTCLGTSPPFEPPIDCTNDTTRPTILNTDFNLINGGARLTSSRTVTLNLAAQDDCGISGYSIAPVQGPTQKTRETFFQLCELNVLRGTPPGDIVNIPPTETFIQDVPFTFPSTGSDPSFLGACISFVDTNGNLNGVTDGIAFSTEKPVILGFDANPPFTFINDQSIISVDALDPNDDPLSYDWSSTCGVLSSTVGPEDKIFTASNVPGFCTVDVTVTDPFGNTATQSIELGVTPLDCPIADSSGPISHISLNNGAASTTSTTVTMNLEATDQCGVARYQVAANPFTGLAVQQLCELSGLRGTITNPVVIPGSPKAFLENVPLTFPSGSNDGTACVIFQDTRGNTTAIWDDIIFLVPPGVP